MDSNGTYSLQLFMLTSLNALLSIFCGVDAQFMTDVKPPQPRKARTPIEVTELGMVMDVIFEPLTKLSGNILTPLPIVADVIPPVVILPFDEQFFAFQIRLVKPLQPSKAFSPIEVTELGIVTDVKPMQP